MFGSYVRKYSLNKTPLKHANLLSIKYMGAWYGVEFKYWYRIQYLKIRLIITRLFRYIKRMVSYARPSVIIIICMLFFIGLAYFWGKAFKGYTLLDTIWDFKNAILSTLFISFFVHATSQERSRNKRLLARHDIYVDVMDEIETIIEKIGNIFGFQFDFMFLYTRPRFDRVRKKISDSNPDIDISEDTKRKLIQLYEKYKDILVEYKREIILNVEEKEKWDIEYSIKNIRMVVDKTLSMLYESPNITGILEEFDHLVMHSYFLIEELRMPWRKDQKINFGILVMLSISNREQIASDFYYSKLLDIDNTAPISQAPN